MFIPKFFQIKNLMHTFSRSPIADGQKWIDQTVAPAGHNVYASNVRAEDIPFIASIAERDADYLISLNGKRVIGGPKGGPFYEVMKFIDKYGLKEIPNTNGEAYVVIDELGNHVTNFIDPADKPITQYTLSNGYEFIMYAEDGITKISRNYGWSFDPFNGIVHFEGKNPKSADWEFGAPKVEGFIYIGKSSGELLGIYANNFNYVSDELTVLKNSAITIQPFKFSTNEMTTVGEPYKIDESSPDFFQKLTIVIPAYVFELTSLDRDEHILTEMSHFINGDTQIFLDLPWHVEQECPIMSYTYESGQDGIGQRIPVVGKYKFIASAFVAKDGSKIQCNPLVDYEQHPDHVIPPPPPHGPNEPFEDGVAVRPHPLPPPPPPPQHSDYFHHPYPVDPLTVNIN